MKQTMINYGKHLIGLALLAAVSAPALAQTPPPDDGFYKYETHKGAKPVPLPEVNKNNIKFYKRVYKDIDLSNPKNGFFAVQGESLIEVIMEGIEEGKITAYSPASTKEDPTGDGFTTPITYREAMGTLTDSVLVPIFDEEGNQVDAVMKMNDFSPATVTAFRIKEDIFFDKQRSRIEHRIIGIAPLKKVDAGDELMNKTPAFWLYFPDCRDVFVTKVVSDPQRNIDNMSFDNIFLQQRFEAEIVKEAGPDEMRVTKPKQIEKEIEEYKEETWKY